jgi:hypothetical protein
MNNINIKLNLKQLNHAIITTPKGAKCLLIPIRENNLFEGEKGIYLDLTAWELKENKAGSKDTHLIKQSLPKDVFEAMTDHQKKEMKIIGNAAVWNSEAKQTKVEKTEPKKENEFTPNDDDLPF